MNITNSPSSSFSKRKVIKTDPRDLIFNCSSCKNRFTCFCTLTSTCDYCESLKSVGHTFHRVINSI